MSWLTIWTKSVTIMSKNWSTLSNVHIQATFNRFWFIVLTLVQSSLPVISWWIEYLMVGFTCFTQNSPPSCSSKMDLLMRSPRSRPRPTKIWSKACACSIAMRETICEESFHCCLTNVYNLFTIYLPIHLLSMNDFTTHPFRFDFTLQHGTYPVEIACNLKLSDNLSRLCPPPAPGNPMINRFIIICFLFVFK